MPCEGAARALRDPSSLAAALLLLLPLLLATACRHRNSAVAADDIPLHLELHRSWVTRRANNDSTPIDLPFDCDLDELDSIEELVALPVTYLFHLGFEGVINAVAHTAGLVGKTKVVAYPALDRAYRQRLYWGENVLYFPATTAPDDARLLLHITGDREASITLPVDLAAGRLSLE